jgi:hypothetical protein
MREIGLRLFIFNKLHYLESVILNTTTLTMTTMHSTDKRTGTEQYNDIAIIIKIIQIMCSFVRTILFYCYV